jgi:hypothetical protein
VRLVLWAHTEVKHNRVTEFKRANLRNVLDAVGALFLLIIECEISPRGAYHYLNDGGSMAYIIEGWPLLMKKSLAEK